MPAVAHPEIMRIACIREGAHWECAVRETQMGRLVSILLAVSGTVGLQVAAQAVLLLSVRFIDRRMRGANELRRTF